MGEEIIESGCGNITILAGDTMPEIVHVTDSAKKRIEELMMKESNESVFRLTVEGGGCSGFQYQFLIHNEIFEDDIINDWNTGKLLVDNFSIRYLKGATVDYVKEIAGEYFHVINPGAKSKCGCGSSFSYNMD